MKRPIRHEYFLKIQKGEKSIDYRAAHITFEDTQTGRKCVRDVVSVCFMSRSALPRELNREVLFGDDQWVIAFTLAPEEKKVKKSRRG